MVNQNKKFSYKIKRQAKNILPSDVERTIVWSREFSSFVSAYVALNGHSFQNLLLFSTAAVCAVWWP